MPTTDPARTTPAVTVLMATFNGARFLDEQLDSILSQEDVELTVVVSDDGSTDGTLQLLAERAASDPRIRLLPPGSGTGRPADNFYRLLVEVDTGTDLVAFADQDDVWRPDKVARHAALLAGGADGVSSNVTSFDADGHLGLVRKDFPQRRWDHLLESPGPGSTFLLSPALAARVRQVLTERPQTRAIDYHDWLVYVIARSAGLSWVIDATPTVRYRQHESNAMGANQGWRSAWERLRLINNHWHRDQATQLAAVALDVAPTSDRPAVQHMHRLLAGRGFTGRVGLLRQVGQLRRRPRDRAVIGLLIATGVW